MKDNPFDKFDKPSEYLLPGEKEETYIKNISGRISEEKKLTNILPMKWVIGIAAALLITATVFLLQPTDLKQLAENNYSAYKNYKEETTRGEVQLSEAYVKYNNGNYSEAVIAFEREDKLSGLDALYYAISLQAEGNWKKSLPVIQNAKQELPIVHLDAYDWHLALNYLALGNKQKAASIFNQIIEEESSQFLDKARALSKKLD